jgi:large repetitive protein
VVRKIAVLVAGGSLVLGVAAASPALARTRPAPIQQLCSASANGGTLTGGVCVLPAGVVGGANAYYGIIAVSNPNAGDTFKVISGTVPPGLTVLPQYGSGTIVTGTPTQAGTFVFTVQATSPQGASATLAYSITATQQSADRLVCDASNGGTLVNGICVLPSASVGQSYEAFIITSSNSGGTFAITSGSLPPGLSMPSSYGASGTIVAGTPTQQGTFTFTVKGTDQQGQPLQQAYTITVGPAPPLAIVLPASGATLGPGQVGVAYAQNFFLSGGVAPYTWSVASAQLPPGLALRSTAGPSDNNNQLAGTPTTAGTFTFAMKLTDGSGQQATQQFSLTIQP